MYRLLRDNVYLAKEYTLINWPWAKDFSHACRPRVGSSKGPKPVVMRGPERVLP